MRVVKKLFFKLHISKKLNMYFESTPLKLSEMIFKSMIFFGSMDLDTLIRAPMTKTFTDGVLQ